MNSKSSDTEPVIVDGTDRDAARRALALNWPHLDPSSGEYRGLLDCLAEFHRSCGADNFELRYDLRPPKDRTDKWTLQLMREQIKQAEFNARLRADAQRPIDIEMLTTFCDAYQAKIAAGDSTVERPDPVDGRERILETEWT